MGRIYIQCFIVITLKTCKHIYIHKYKHTYLCMDYTYSYTVLCRYKIQWNLSWGAEESEKLCTLTRTEASSFPISCWSRGVSARVKSSSQVYRPHPLLHWSKLRQHLMSRPLCWRTHSFIKKKICAQFWSMMEREKFSNWYICEEPCGQTARREWQAQSLTKITPNVILDSELRLCSDGLMSYQIILPGNLL